MWYSAVGGYMHVKLLYQLLESVTDSLGYLLTLENSAKLLKLWIIFICPYSTRGQTSEVDAILFTNPQPATLRDESLHLSHPPYSHPIPQGSAAAVPARVTRTPLYLSKQVTDNIHRNRHRFETFLKKSCNASVGKFNPWVIVEE